jgi:Spy/CpxP family protein refolding chaperone
MGPATRASIVLVAVFGLGAVAGYALHDHLGASAPPHLAAAPSGAEVHEAAMSELREVLDLDDAQVAQIHALMAERQETVQRIWEQLRPEVQQAMTEVHEDIARLLRPEQRQRFHQWLQQQRQLHESQNQTH